MKGNITQLLDKIIEEASHYKLESFKTFDLDGNVTMELSYDKVEQVVEQKNYKLVFKRPYLIMYVVHIPSNNVMNWHCHNHSEVMVVLKGSCTFESLSGTVYCSAGDSVSYDVRVPHKFSTESGCTILLTITL